MKLADVQKLDRADPLAAKRAEFDLPEGLIYLDGNSLGPPPRWAKQYLHSVVDEQWGKDLISSWNRHDWINLPHSVGDKIAKLVGAKPGQVVCCDSISVNLFKVLSVALAANPKRTVVLSQQDNFPTDLYTAQGLAELLGAQRCQLTTVPTVKLEHSIDESVAVLLLTHVNFRSGEMHDLKAITQLAHDKGVLVVWDLAHSAGAMPLELDAAEVDFAVGCGYKYLNGGPGAPAFIYVNKRHHGCVLQPLSGWMGHAKPFDFSPEYRPASGVQQFLSGTPPILSMAVLSAAMDVFADIDMHTLRTKSIGLSELFMQCVQELPALGDLECISPLDPAQRGSQLAFEHDEAFAISQALIDHGVIVDFRAPNIIRFGFAPLYTRYQDVWQAAQLLHEILSSKTFLQEKYQKRQTVT